MRLEPKQNAVSAWNGAPMHNIGSGPALCDSRLVSQRIYSRNKRGQIVRLEDHDRGYRTLVYDRAGQIVDDIRERTLSSTFGYDPCGNPADARMASGNRLDSFRNTRYSHDARGNVVKQIYGDEVCKRTFNLFNQMVAYEAPDGTRTEYVYDAVGRRILKKSGNKETRYYWDQFHLCGEQTGTHRTQYIYYPDSFTPMCCLQDDKAYFYHTDHLGTPMEMTDEEGYRVWFGTYGTFGYCHVKDISVIENNLRLAGQYYDSESRLHYNCFRYYDPIVGRYISQDPISYAGGDYNLYRYVQNDPVNLMDPVGLAVPLVLAAPAAAKGVAAGGVALFKALKVTFFLCSAALAAAGIIKVQENTEEKPEVDEKCSGTDSGDDGDVDSRGPSSQGRMQKEVERGQAPKDIERVDKGHVPEQEPHVHFKDGTSSTQSGNFHDAHKGIPNPSNKAKSWLNKHTISVSARSHPHLATIRAATPPMPGWQAAIAWIAF
jgi:RHS repeat-associated protein